MSNAIEIEIKDFQSLHHVKINLEPGITMITGPTNRGKSAIIRAVDSAIFNMGDDSMVRAGQRYAGVSIDNGSHKMMFMRDSKGKNEKTAYQFDGGAVQKKVGRSQLPEVSKFFNIRDVRMQNNTKMKINFWYQNDKPFLMDKTAGQLYEFLSLSSCDAYTKILKLMVVDMKVMEADINNITTEIDTLKVVNAKKEKFVKDNEGFDDLYIRIIEADSRDKKLEEVHRDILRIENIIPKIRERVDSLKKVSTTLSNIPIDEIETRYSGCIKVDAELREISDGVKKYKAVEELRVKKAEDYNSKSTALGDIQSSVEKSKDILDSVVSLSSTIKDIEGDISRIGKLDSEIEKRKSSLDKISVIPIDESISSVISGFGDRRTSLKDLGSLLDKYKRIGDNLSTLENQLSEIKSKSKDNEDELEKLKESAGYCPFCGTVFSKED